MANQESVRGSVSDFEAGKLLRDDYWRKMQQFHLNLQDYRGLVEKSILQRIEIDAEDLSIVLKNGLKMRWRPEDIRTAPSMLVNHGEYEPVELSIISQLAGSCRVVFDVGANIGWYSLHLGQQLRESQGQVYSFEPVPQTFAELTHNIEVNGCGDTVRAFNIALGEAAKSIQFYIPAFTGSVAASAHRLFPDDENRTVECQVVTLDEFVRTQQIKQVDLIKCDVEGSELFVLQGAPETIATHKPIIMLEMLRKWAKAFGYHPNDIIALLRGYGYRGWYYEDSGFHEIPEMGDDCTQTNFFFLHDSKHENLLAQVEVPRFVAPRATSDQSGQV
jgi:FkbM family methyltransferase